MVTWPNHPTTQTVGGARAEFCQNVVWPNHPTTYRIQMSEKGARQKQRKSQTNSKTSQRRNTTKVTKPSQYMHAHHKEHGPPSAHNQVHKGSITDPKPDRTASSRRDQNACENPVHEGQFIRRNGSAIHINESDTHMNRNHKQTTAPSRRYRSGYNQTLNIRPRNPTRKIPQESWGSYAAAPRPLK